MRSRWHSASAMLNYLQSSTIKAVLTNCVVTADIVFHSFVQ